MADLTGMMQAAAGAAGGGILVQEVFSTTLYTGTGASRTVTTGIDALDNGALFWIKSRTTAEGHRLTDTVRGPTKHLETNFNGGQDTDSNRSVTATSTGFTTGPTSSAPNTSGTNYVVWTFRKAPKFFDIVTYTGTGANRTVAHNLGSVPGCIWVKRLDTTGNWQVYHRANTAAPETDFLVVNDNAATVDSNTRWNDTQPTDAVFSLGTEATVNASGGTYVAYLWAHDAGGFGGGGENGISCGSFTTNGSGKATVNLGYEPQFVIFKSSSNVGDWKMVDTKRGFSANPNATGKEFLNANLSQAAGIGTGIGLLSTGFDMAWFANQTLIYIAIRADM